MKIWLRIPINVFSTAFFAALSYVTLIAILNQGVGFGEPFLGGFVLQVLFHAAFTLVALTLFVVPVFVIMPKLISNILLTRVAKYSLLFAVLLFLYSYILNEFWLGALVPSIVGVVAFYLFEYLTTKSRGQST